MEKSLVMARSAFTGKRRNASSYHPAKAAQCPHTETYVLPGGRGARICGECGTPIYPVVSTD
jgi:CO/xanthine dehydrogenase Mo-binding subunit